MALDVGVVATSAASLLAVVLMLAARWNRGAMREMTALAGFSLIAGSSFTSHLVQIQFCASKTVDCFPGGMGVGITSGILKLMIIIGFLFLMRPMTERLFRNNWLRDSSFIVFMFLLLSFVTLQ